MSRGETHCKTCGAEVRWITSPSGRPQIVDADWRVEWVVSEVRDARGGRIALIQDDGRIAKGFLASATVDGARQIEGYVSHWATCTSPPSRPGLKR